VIPRATVPTELTSLARVQGGAIARAQVHAAGLTDEVVGRLLRTGTWRRLAPGVYGLGPDTWLQRVWAGLLLGGPDAVAGGLAAARLSHLPLDDPAGAEAAPIDVYVGRSHAAPVSDGRWRFFRADRVGELVPRRTRPARTIVDLAEHATADQLAGLVGGAIQRHQVSARAILAELSALKRHRQRHLLMELVAAANQGVTSALEWRYVRDVERAHGLPRAERQAKPLSLYRVDNLYADYDVIVELDSQAYHRGAAAGVDLERDRVHASQGYLTLRLTWGDVVDRPCRTASEVGAALAGKGWRGRVVPCPRCGPLDRPRR